MRQIRVQLGHIGAQLSKRMRTGRGALLAIVGRLSGSSQRLFSATKFPGIVPLVLLSLIIAPWLVSIATIGNACWNNHQDSLTLPVMDILEGHLLLHNPYIDINEWGSYGALPVYLYLPFHLLLAFLRLPYRFILISILGGLASTLIWMRYATEFIGKHQSYLLGMLLSFSPLLHIMSRGYRTLSILSPFVAIFVYSLAKMKLRPKYVIAAFASFAVMIQLHVITDFFFILLLWESRKLLKSREFWIGLALFCLLTTPWLLRPAYDSDVKSYQFGDEEAQTPTFPDDFFSWPGALVEGTFKPSIGDKPRSFWQAISLNRFIETENNLHSLLSKLSLAVVVFGLLYGLVGKDSTLRVWILSFLCFFSLFPYSKFYHFLVLFPAIFVSLVRFCSVNRIRLLSYALVLPMVLLGVMALPALVSGCTDRFKLVIQTDELLDMVGYLEDSDSRACPENTFASATTGDVSKVLKAYGVCDISEEILKNFVVLPDTMAFLDSHRKYGDFILIEAEPTLAEKGKNYLTLILCNDFTNRQDCLSRGALTLNSTGSLLLVFEVPSHITCPETDFTATFDGLTLNFSCFIPEDRMVCVSEPVGLGQGMLELSYAPRDPRDGWTQFDMTRVVVLEI